MNPGELRHLSVSLEQQTGFDSIPTIERVYEESDGGAYLCVFPGCGFKRKDATAMWLHVHFGPHGRPFGPAGPDLLLAGTTGRAT